MSKGKAIHIPNTQLFGRLQSPEWGTPSSSSCWDPGTSVWMGCQPKVAGISSYLPRACVKYPVSCGGNCVPVQFGHNWLFTFRCEYNEALWVWPFQGPDSTGMCLEVGNRVYFSWVRIRFESHHHFFGGGYSEERESL